MSATATTPVVFLVFNRPENTAQVLRQIRRARPRMLLVVADGPRRTFHRRAAVRPDAASD